MVEPRWRPFQNRHNDFSDIAEFVDIHGIVMKILIKHYYSQYIETNGARLRHYDDKTSVHSRITM